MSLINPLVPEGRKIYCIGKISFLEKKESWKKFFQFSQKSPNFCCTEFIRRRKSDDSKKNYIVKSKIIVNRTISSNPQ